MNLGLHQSGRLPHREEASSQSSCPCLTQSGQSSTHCLGPSLCRNHKGQKIGFFLSVEQALFKFREGEVKKMGENKQENYIFAGKGKAVCKTHREGSLSPQVHQGRQR